MKKSLFLTLATFIVILFSSCDQETIPADPSNLTAPALPAQEMYEMPTAVLNQMDTDTVSAQRNGRTYWNWLHAGTNLLVWHTVVVVNSAVPFASFGAALNEDPVFIGNGTFEWTYTYDAPGGDRYDVALTAQYINNAQDVKWVMTLSKVGGFQNFEWYTGIVSRDHTEAEFILNHRPHNPEPYIRINYQRNPGNEDASLRYTNVIPNHDGRQGYVEYRVASEGTFNRAFDVKGGVSDPDNFLEIEWNYPDGDGRVKHERRFGDTDWHCWDADQIDTDC